MKLSDNVYETLRLLDPVTFRHSLRVRQYAEYVADYFSLEDAETLSVAALLHDIGKVYVSPKILDKPGALSGLERQLVNLHAWIGYDILGQYEEVPETVRYIVLYHHTFTPVTLSDVPECQDKRTLTLAKMLHTIDSFEALTADRPYRRGFSADQAVEIMKQDSSYDAKVMDFLSRLAGNLD